MVDQYEILDSNTIKVNQTQNTARSIVYSKKDLLTEKSNRENNLIYHNGIVLMNQTRIQEINTLLALFTPPPVEEPPVTEPPPVEENALD